MRTAEWILTFDDGPLPSDVTSFKQGQGDKLLDPLRSILATLESHQPKPISAVFFLRGPAYPWAVGNKPPKSLFRRGVEMLLAADHFPALHCYSHDPKLWWNWWVNEDKIHADLDRCLRYFTELANQPIELFRPPYGQGGSAGEKWAKANGIRHRRWDIDTDDWLHHPDVEKIFRRFVKKGEASDHLEHIRSVLPWRMALHTLWPGANDFLLHVSKRTAQNLPGILDAIVEFTRDWQHEPEFVVPSKYLRP